MTLRLIPIAVAMCAVAAPAAHAQLAVFDPTNLAQVVLIAQRAQRQYDELVAQHQTIVRMSQGLGRLDRFRTAPLALVRHDPARWPNASRLMTALNAGDVSGTAYLSAVVPLEPSASTLESVPRSARRTFERRYATAEIADAVATAATHQVGRAREYASRLQGAVDALDGDVRNPDSRFHQVTAILDKVAIGELLARRQDMVANQLLSNAIEQLLARGKRQRDAEATALNMQLTTWKDRSAANEAFVAGTGDALRTWRQP